MYCIVVMVLRSFWVSFLTCTYIMRCNQVRDSATELHLNFAGKWHVTPVLPIITMHNPTSDCRVQLAIWTENLRFVFFHSLVNMR